MEEEDLPLFNRTLESLINGSNTILKLWIQSVKLAKKSGRYDKEPTTRPITEYFEQSKNTTKETEEN